MPWAPTLPGLSNFMAGALASAWPDAVDDLTSAVRAGLALPEAVVEVGRRVPPELRAAFEAFETEYRATARFGPALDVLKHELAERHTPGGIPEKYRFAINVSYFFWLK